MPADAPDADHDDARVGGVAEDCEMVAADGSERDEDEVGAASSEMPSKAAKRSIGGGGTGAAAAGDSLAAHPAEKARASVVSVVSAQDCGAAAVDKPRRLPTLLPSVFENRGPVLLFSYTTACGATQRDMSRALPTGPECPKMYYGHTDKVHEYNAVLNICRQGGLYRVRPDSLRWTLLWSNHPPPETLQAMKPIQRTNHYPGSFHLGRKDLLWKNIGRMQKRCNNAFEITPEAFVLPREQMAFDAARKRRPDELWIWKPCSSSCGRGIRVLSNEVTAEDAREIQKKRGVCQRYIPNPMLINGFKFDLRIYVVVLSYDPLKVYINGEGLVRIATEKYSRSPESLSSRTMHLTNYSVNKHAPAFIQNTDGRGQDGVQQAGGGTVGENEDESTAFKWSLEELKTYFGQHKMDYGQMWEGIKDVCIKTLVAVEPAVRQEFARSVVQDEEGWTARGNNGCHRSSCFEMYGFDVLVDDEMKSWLLEVNICPSLSSGSPLDKRIKTKLVADTFTLSGIRPPPAMWPANTEAAKRAGGSGVVDPDSQDYGSTINSMTQEALAKRAARLSECKSPLDAVKMFDKADWDLVMDDHDEDMRSGDLERIYPTSTAAQYGPLFEEEESYCNLVLRRWHEAGGGRIFSDRALSSCLPSWLPRQVCFTRT